MRGKGGVLEGCGAATGGCHVKAAVSYATACGGVRRSVWGIERKLLSALVAIGAIHELFHALSQLGHRTSGIGDVEGGESGGRIAADDTLVHQPSCKAVYPWARLWSAHRNRANAAIFGAAGEVPGFPCSGQTQAGGNGICFGIGDVSILVQPAEAQVTSEEPATAV